MSQLCPKCNCKIDEDDMAQIIIRDGQKLLAHSTCPSSMGTVVYVAGDIGEVYGAGGGGSGVSYSGSGGSSIKTEERKTHKEITFFIKIDQDENYVIADDEESEDVEDKWNDQDFGNSSACQTYEFTVNVPIPQGIIKRKITIPPEVMQEMVAKIKVD